ncbi:hypothetical protein C3747_53g107 [Trypanosoma cruzi]|uniref:Transmembrane protein n=2 Tax=Trypanosoma cruzi TaxID=5693 RepID=Q4DEX3_TRYCC|nr:hypothetical protein, conserved [Trypanosoma cruzi]EAN91072.1 hypothetical protein, conserved [Trypanosoma cruzi]PWV12240.1 hypothetical protein C3747_53g107 [Trypanosoma cruzi]RNC58336.1 hypothetical protein TcCL_ESM04061 [Trypanosoma cruzi]|eukprot:XP_812923.1 hypothetical protein [Trypanosoma cruzi strain CL Brener]
MAYESPARVKWATAIFWNVLDPAFRTHFKYYRRKVAVDRYLERKGVVFNVAVGVTFGLTLYFTVVSKFLLPAPVASEYSMEDNAKEILRAMKCDTTKELPAFLLMRAKREIIGKLHVAADRAEVKHQREEVERLLKTLNQQQDNPPLQ